jgi:hypothetical protein
VLPNLSLFNLTLTPTLKAEVRAAQKDDEGMGHIKRRMLEGDPKFACFREDAQGTLWFKERLVVPNRESLKKKILDEAHASRYSIHPGSTKMYHDVRQQFWWTRMKREAARYVSECDTYRKVKTDYMKPVTTTKYCRMEVGGYKHGLHCGFTYDGPQVEFNLGDRRSTLQISSFHTRSHQLQCSKVCKDLYRSCAMLARSSEDNNLRSRNAVCRSLLGTTARVPRNSPDP